MTIIAYRDGVMASDSRVTFGESEGIYVIDSCIKLFRVRKSIVGAAGDSAPGMKWIEWYKRAGSKKSAPNLGGAHIIVATSEGLFEADDGGDLALITGPYYAIGCGAKVALGAMFMGASAVQAANAACKYDPYCGGKIITMEL
jgi:ATP-dependent protease HslVU (ClpYQ) peptidase subunit